MHRYQQNLLPHLLPANERTERILTLQTSTLLVNHCHLSQVFPLVFSHTITFEIRLSHELVVSFHRITPMFLTVITCSTLNKLTKYCRVPMKKNCFFLTKSRETPISMIFLCEKGAPLLQISAPDCVPNNIFVL